MLDIGSFFERFRGRELEEFAFRSAVIDAVKKTFDYELNPSDISYSNGVVSIRSSPALKSSIFLKKKELIGLIQKGTKRKISDVR